jgi:hypothetical protein
MPIIDVIERARREPPIPPRDGLFPDQRYICKVHDPVAWDPHEVERKLGVEIPPDLAELWHACGGLILYEDNMAHGWGHQWGLVVHAPPDPEIFTLNREYYKRKSDRVLRGDLIFADFWGDLELGLIRSDKSAPDYGSIVIVSEMGPREEWAIAAASLEEFLIRFMDAHGEKYWEYHYRRKQAERTTEDLLRSRRVN